MHSLIATTHSPGHTGRSAPACVCVGQVGERDPAGSLQAAPATRVANLQHARLTSVMRLFRGRLAVGPCEIFTATFVPNFHRQIAGLALFRVSADFCTSGRATQRLQRRPPGRQATAVSVGKRRSRIAHLKARALAPPATSTTARAIAYHRCRSSQRHALAPHAGAACDCRVSSRRKNRCTRASRPCGSNTAPTTAEVALSRVTFGKELHLACFI